MKGSNQGGLFFIGLFVAAGLALGGYFVGQTMYNAKVALNTAEAKGLAERRVLSNRANWNIGYSVEGATRAEVTELYKQIEGHQQTILKILKDNGFDENEIEVGVLDYVHKEYRDENNNLVDQEHILAGMISVETEKVALVGEVRVAVSKLIAQGINIENWAPTYHFTELNKIKPEMLREATKNARIAANEFAENAGVKVGGIRSARQGGFNVRDAGEQYEDTRKIEKDIRVVTTITFYLTE
jgi:hypothetical protein